MSLIKCPECGNTISDKAKVCIYCGYPISKYVQPPEDADANETDKSNEVSVSVMTLDVHKGDVFTFGEFPQTEASVHLPVPIDTGYGLDETKGAYYSDFDVVQEGTIGRLLYGIDKADKKHFYQVEPIEWEVIYETKDAAFVLSTKILKFLPFATNPIQNYLDSEVRFYLNHFFFNIAFSSAEKQMILDTAFIEGFSIPNPPDIANSPFGKDKLFLPSVAELLDAGRFHIIKEKTDYATGSAGQYGYFNSWLTRTIDEPDELGRVNRMIAQSHSGTQPPKVQPASAKNACGIAPAMWVQKSMIKY